MLWWCGSSGVTSFGSLVGLGFMDVLKDFAGYVMGAVYSLNRGERLNIDKSFIDIFKTCNSIAFLHFLLTVVGGLSFFTSVVFF